VDTLSKVSGLVSFSDIFHLNDVFDARALGDDFRQNLHLVLGANDVFNFSLLSDEVDSAGSKSIIKRN